MDQKECEPGSVVYDGAVAAIYPEARAFSAETVETWVSVLRAVLRPSGWTTVLDLGCGTGRFASLIASRFQARVIGIDVSVSMLEQARRLIDSPSVLLLYATAERLPLRNESCDLAWLSQVIHHISGRECCAGELYRVLRPGGCVLIRGVFGDRLDGFPDHFRFFPGAREIVARYPAADQVAASFQAAGFVVESFQSVRQKTCNSLSEFAARTRLRADSTLRLLSDSEFERCQMELEQAAAREATPSPVIETLDLLVLKKALQGANGDQTRFQFETGASKLNNVSSKH